MITKQAIFAIMALFILTVSGAGVMAYSTHTPIRIDSNNDFSTYASSGNGTEQNPWIIDDLEINGTGYGYCIYIGNTTDYFSVEECYLHDAYTSNPDDFYRPNAGIVLNNVENAIITGNEIEFNDCMGIFLYVSSNNTIQDNNVIGNDYGIYLFEDSNDNSILYNNVTCNNDIGIAIDYSNGNEIYRNTVDYNELGIYINEASGNLIDDNIASYNEYAVYFEGATYNEITYNSLCLSGSYGVYLDANSNYNEIYTNNFGNNVAQASDAGYNNQWDSGYSNGGNYWTDDSPNDNYCGANQDQPGSDEYGDSAYNGIGGGHSDPYQRMACVETYGLGQREEPNGLGQREEPN